MAETGTDPSMAIRKLKTRGFGSGSPASALVLSLSGGGVGSGGGVVDVVPVCYGSVEYL